MSNNLNEYNTPADELIRTMSQPRSAIERTNDEFEEQHGFTPDYETQTTGRRAPQLQTGYVYNVAKNGNPYISVDASYKKTLIECAVAFLDNPTTLAPNSWTMTPTMRGDNGELTEDGHAVQDWAKIFSLIIKQGEADPEMAQRFLTNIANDIAWNTVSAMDSCLSLIHRADIAAQRQQDVTSNDKWLNSLGYAQTAYMNAWKAFNALRIAYGVEPQVDWSRAVETQTKRTRDYLHGVFCGPTQNQQNVQSSLNERFGKLRELAAKAS